MKYLFSYKRLTAVVNDSSVTVLSCLYLHHTTQKLNTYINVDFVKRSISRFYTFNVFGKLSVK